MTQKRRGEGERERELPPRVTTTGMLGVPMVPHATLRTLKVHMVRVVDRLRSEQVTIVAFVIIGHVPQVVLIL